MSMTNEEIFNTMQDLVAEQFAIEPEEVSMESSFEEDLGACFLWVGITWPRPSS